MAEKIYAAGSILIGNYSPESAWDYSSGTNYTLPTSRCARSYSALGVESFMTTRSFWKIQAEWWFWMRHTWIYRIGNHWFLL
ncbi:MAG: histidinol dehydrogenase [Bacteroidales bacterium]|nr:histidinol dehydrogenase [Bacteroidales bacterium]MDY6001650.1 histidinol dehydrogenase [Candidatus Cryptobacteroides sp.]